MALTTQLLVLLGGLPTSNASAKTCSWLKEAETNTQYHDTVMNRTGLIESKENLGRGHVELEGKLIGGDLTYAMKSDWKGECPWQPIPKPAPESTALSCDWFFKAKLGDRAYDTHIDSNGKKRGVIKSYTTNPKGIRTQLTVQLDANSQGESLRTVVTPEPCWWQPEDVTVASIEGEDELKMIEEDGADWDEDDDEPELKEQANGYFKLTAEGKVKAVYEENANDLIEKVKDHPMHKAAIEFQRGRSDRDMNSWHKAISGDKVQDAEEAISVFAKVVGKVAPEFPVGKLQDSVDEVFANLAKVDALAGFLNIESPILSDLMNHVAWLQPALQATRSKKVTVAARHLLQSKMTFLETFLPEGPIKQMITLPNALLGVLNDQYQNEKITLRKLARDIVPLTVNSVVAVIGNAHLTDARDIFLITERVLREDTLTELDVTDIFVIGAAATRVAQTVSLGIFPPASVAFGFVTSALELANTLGLFQDPQTEKFLDDILTIADKSPLVRGAFDFGQKLLGAWDAFNDGIQAILNPDHSIKIVNGRRFQVLPIGAQIAKGVEVITKAALQPVAQVIQHGGKAINNVLRGGQRVIRTLHRGAEQVAVATFKHINRTVVTVARGVENAVGNILGAFAPKRVQRRRTRRGRRGLGLEESDIIA